jgi:hypothetical protein
MVLLVGGRSFAEFHRPLASVTGYFHGAGLVFRGDRHRLPILIWYGSARDL